MNSSRIQHRLASGKLCGLLAGIALPITLAVAQPPSAPPSNGGPPSSSRSSQSKKPDYPPHTEVFKDYAEVVSTADGKRPLMSIWTNKKENQMLAALPKDFAKHRFYIALTVAAGEQFAGLQAGEEYFYIKQIGKRLAFIQPNIRIRSTGDQESKDSVARLFTDRVLLDVPIVTILPGWGPVIDMDALLVGQASKFFGYSASGLNARLAVIDKAKTFPENVELAFEVPARDLLKTFHYSISTIPQRSAYKPRKADQRVGYFTTSYSDLGKYRDDQTKVRYINRWHLEKADPKLSLSPAKEPIRFYIEHTAPIRYRRWIREGVLKWNKAFQKVGLDNAIEVHYQDKAAGDYMDLDPEDVRYNFVRWLNNNIGTAIGPSRVNPTTGEILDADIILTDGWIRHYWFQYNELLPELAMEGYGPETLAWLEQNPRWDPRIRLAPPSERDRMIRERMARGPAPLGGHAIGQVDTQLIGDNEFDGLVGRVSQVNGFCKAADCKAIDMAMMRMYLDMFVAEDDDGDGDGGKDGDGEKDDKGEKKPEKKEDTLDGIPEWFVGPLLAELVAHEVGHTIGLRHNFKATSIYTIDEINSESVKGKKPFAGSVMDYIPVNISMGDREKAGDHTMIDIGPYDMWAIEYGYSFAPEPELEKILSRNTEPELAYATDEDTWDADPYARRYDFGKDPLTYAKDQIKLAHHHRERLIEKFVKDGDSWAKARQGYEMTLSVHLRSVSMMANWLGGTFINRAKKGDPNAQDPIQVVPAQDQRDAIQFVLKNTFEDGAFGLSPDLLAKMSTDKWLDISSSGFFFLPGDAPFPVHDRIMGIQASTLTMLMTPYKLGRVYDNEFYTPADQDMLTLPEILEMLYTAVWKELDSPEDKPYSARKPLISSLRRNLQREYVERLIDLTMPSGYASSSASKPISNLALAQLRRLNRNINKVLDTPYLKLDPYSEAHLSEATLRIQKALDAQYIYNVSDMGGGGFPFTIIIGEDGQPKTQ